MMFIPKSPPERKMSKAQVRALKRDRPPMYASDRRYRFRERESKSWLRVVTVFGYLMAVSFPAGCLTVYYVAFWSPDYANRFPRNFTDLGDTIEARLFEMREMKGSKFRYLDALNNVDNRNNKNDDQEDLTTFSSSPMEAAQNRCRPCECSSREKLFNTTTTQPSYQPTTLSPTERARKMINDIIRQPLKAK